MSATQTGSSLTFTYDALGRKLTEAGRSAPRLDLEPRRTRAPRLPGGGITETYDRDVTGLVTKVRENGATTGIGVLATYAYDNLERRTAVANGNGTSSSYSFDPVSRLSSLTQDLGGTLNDLTITSAPTIRRARSSPKAAPTTSTLDRARQRLDRHGDERLEPARDGRRGGGGPRRARQPHRAIRQAATATLTASENLLTSATVSGNAVTLDLRPLLRLTQVAGTATTRFGYDGLETLAEADGGGTILRRYAPATGSTSRSSGTRAPAPTDRRWLHADERGSIVSISDASGNMLGINAYDDIGKGARTSAVPVHRQKWLPSLALTTTRRASTPGAGRFLQTTDRYGAGRTSMPMCGAIQ